VNSDRTAKPKPRMRMAAAAAVLLLAGVAAPARAEGPIVELIAAVKPSVVAIGAGDDILGSGFAVGDGAHVLTALHVLRGAPRGRLAIRIGQGAAAETAEVKQVAADEENDLALLRIEGRTLPALRLFLGKPLSEGEEVAFTGYAIRPVDQLYASTRRGIVSAIAPVGWGGMKPGAYQLDVNGVPGDSGGPVVDPSDGAVVGIVNAAHAGRDDDGADRPSGLTFALPIPPAIEFLKKAGLEP